MRLGNKRANVYGFVIGIKAVDDASSFVAVYYKLLF